MFFKVFGPILLVIIAVIIFMDAKNRNMNAWLWGILTILLNIVGVIIYLIVRKPKY